ncbi:MAG TPA: acetyl-CoA hydrolase/transferase C-terminal domain-containing protein [Sandaracinaceae bacterium LLY-WYZ-13_1]|nr:acetyl-CoA hydrolase/transferase C-terminal domain-containing protein [Sandaracinaceae bacterium LLY-WYZ-13_1]
MKIVDADTALSAVRSGMRVYVHEAMMAPRSLIDALTERCRDLHGVEVVHLHTNAPAPYVAPEMSGRVRHNALFTGPNVREAVQAGRADFTPVFLSEIPQLFCDGTLPLDVALVQVSPPDSHGFCRLGVSVATARSAVDHADVVIAEINPHVPRTLGFSSVHVSKIDYAVEVDRPLPEVAFPEPQANEREIGEHIANQIPNGACLQMGIGTIPDATLAALHGHEDLGIHTEMFSDGLIDLVEKGVVNCRLKNRWPGRIVTSFAMGTKRLVDFVDMNPFVEFHPSELVNDPAEIKKMEQMVAINSAIEIDLTGQVCADSIGDRIYSGIGGQMDFMRGAVRSPGGKAFIALPSTAKEGEVSRIVPRLKPGAGVVTTRGHVQYVVTEHGVVNLRGRSLRQRAEMLISIAHPDHRRDLRRAAADRHLFAPV